MRALSTLLGAVLGKRGATALVFVASLLLGASAVAGAAVIRDRAGEESGAAAAALAASCGTDEFEGTTLDDARWDVLRPAGGGPTVSGGKLNLELRNGDLINGTASAENVVLQDAPTGGWRATTEFNIGQINAQGEQAGIVLWKSEGPPNENMSFGKIMFIQTQDANTRVMESIWTDAGGLAVPINDSRTPVPSLPADADVQLRLTSDGTFLTPEFSIDDGATWTQAGKTVRYEGALRVGLVAVQGASGNGGLVPFERFALECGPSVSVAASPTSGTAPLEVDFTGTVGAGGENLAWDFGDGETATGGTTQTHTFDEPGVYRVSLAATTNGVVTRGSTVVNVAPADPPCPAFDDEFSGNELDARWTLQRPRLTGIRVDGGMVKLRGYGGDMHGTNASARNLLLRNAPAEGPWTATTKIDVSASGQNDQAGFVLWRGEGPGANNFAKIVFNHRGAGGYWVERQNNVNSVTQPGGGNPGQQPTVPAEVWIRVSSDGAANPNLTAEYSTDGTTWTVVKGTGAADSIQIGGTGPLRIGLGRWGDGWNREIGFDFLRVTSALCDEEPPPPCPAPEAPEAGFTRIWDGQTQDGWTQAGPGGFDIVNDGAAGCRLLSRGGLGLLWYDEQQYDEFVLRLQWMTPDNEDNSGVFVRFPNPGTDPGPPISQGHEVQIREGVVGEPQKTGSIYNFDREDARNARPAGEWNDYEIRYEDDTYTITLNGTVVNTWENTSNQAQSPGYIGLQNHGADDAVSFRNIRIQSLTDVEPSDNLFTTIGITRSETRDNSQIFGNPTPYSLPAEEMPPSRSVGPADDDAVDNVPVRMPDTSGTLPNLAAFRGQVLELRPEDQKVFSKIHFFGTTTDGGPSGGDFVLGFSDGTTQSIQVRFRDWCAPEDTAEHHSAIGPLTKRYRPNGGEDGAACAIYHVPADVTAGKTLRTVTLPPNTTPAGTNTQSYLMALTLEEPSGAFETPDLSGQLEFPDDQTAPTSTVALNPATPGGSDGWYTDPVQVTLNGTDEAGGSGVDRIQYRVNGGTAVDYDGPFALAQEGVLNLEYRSIDGAGNAEGFKSVQVKVDATAPATAIRLVPSEPTAPGDWYDRTVEVTLTARDGTGSGVATTEYRLGNGAWLPYTSAITVAQDGVHDLQVRSSDVAGNDSDVQSRPLKVDANAPSTAAAITTAAAASGGVYRGPVSIALTAADGSGSGVASTEYRLDGGAWTRYSGRIGVSALGGHMVEFRSRDNAGNVENAKDVVFTIAAPGGTNPPTNPPGGGDPAPDPDPFAGIAGGNRRLSLATLARRGVQVRAVCVGVTRGTLRLTVSRKVARRLGLGRRTVLATKSVRCSGESRFSVSIKPGRKVARKLRQARGSFAATLRLQMSGSAGRVSDTQRVTLRGKQGRG